MKMLKRKTQNHQQTIARLAKERDERRRKEAKLMEELLLTCDKEKIEKVVAEVVRSGVVSSPPLPPIDTGQLSTSTASEAEEEEYRSYGEILFRPDTSQLSNEEKPESAPITFVNQASIAKSPEANESQSAHFPRLSSTPSFEALGDLQIVETESTGLPSPPVSIAHPPVSASRNKQPPPRMISTRKIDSSELDMMDERPFSSFKRSPNRSQPTRRSATPTPSSDNVQFFPRFSMGSGGSPPLVALPEFDFVKSTKISDKQQDNIAHVQRRTSEVSNLAENAVTTSSSADALSSAAVMCTTKSGFPTQTKNVDQVHARGVTEQEIVRPSPDQVALDSSSSAMSTVDTVLVTSFTGYEVKVKYLNTTTDSVANTPPSSVYRTRMPVKKRPLNMESFTSTACDMSTKPRPNSSLPASTASELKLTSLYIGASASVLGASSKAEVTYTSDQESDRELPFVDHKRATTYPHWRKNLLNEQTMKEARENRIKPLEKPTKMKTFQVHPYEVFEPKSVAANPARSQGEAKRKTTFNLWDRKHHAITPTSSRNWRGKQQLITSKPKTNTSSSTTHAQTEASNLSILPPSDNSSLTKVSYSLLQKTAKPTVPSTLLVSHPTSSNIVESAPMDAKNKHSSVLAQDSTKPTTSIASSNSAGALPFSRQRFQPLHAVPFQIPGNPISYQIIQSPATGPASFVPYTISSASDVQSPAARAISSVPTVHSSIAASSTCSNKNALSSTSDAPALLQQPALLAAQPNSLQLPQVPYVFPFSYIVYPPAANGLHYTTLQQSKVITPSNMATVPLGLPQAASHTPPKRSLSPAIPIKPPSRNQSNESAASSTTLSVDSTDFESSKNVAKRARLSDRPLSATSNSNVAVISPQQVPRMAQPQFFLHSNPAGGFMVAPTSNGYSLPLNFFSYPIQPYGGPGSQTCLQAVPMTPGQQLQGISQVWPINQGILPSADSAAELMVSSTNTSSTRTNLLASPILRGSKVD